MPIKNGIDPSKEILQIDNGVKIIFASADSSIKEEAYSIGIFSFKNKPFTIDQLINNIKKAFDSYNLSNII